MLIKRLDWDSDFFGYKIGELIFQKEKNIENVENFDLLYVKYSQDFELNIENFKKDFQETKLVFEKRLVKTQTQTQNIYYFNDVDFDKNALYELAFESGKQSRFKLDSNFKLEKFKELYKKWVDNSVTKSYADDVLVYVENKQIMGFVTYKTNENIATIGLIAVSSAFQGKGIGSKLLNFVENSLLSKGIKDLEIPTQLTNEQACNFYKKQNYTIKETTYIKHYWRK